MSASTKSILYCNNAFELFGKGLDLLGIIILDLVGLKPDLFAGFHVHEHVGPVLELEIPVLVFIGDVKQHHFMLVMAQVLQRGEHLFGRSGRSITSVNTTTSDRRWMASAT